METATCFRCGDEVPVAAGIPLQGLHAQSDGGSSDTQLQLHQICAVHTAADLLRDTSTHAQRDVTSRTQAVVAEIGLTPVELRVLRALMAGSTNRQIARSLDRSPGTIKNIVSRTILKLGACSRTDAVTRAFHYGVVSESFRHGLWPDMQPPAHIESAGRVPRRDETSPAWQ